jgi:hypothetical protein
VDLDAVERNNGLNRTAGPTLFEREDAQYFQLFQVRVDVGHITLDETRCLAHALGRLLCDRPDELKAQRRETVNEVVVGSELERCLSILFVEIVGLTVLDELERVLTELFSVADGDVVCGHGWGVVCRLVFDQCGRGGSPPTASQYSSVLTQNSTSRSSIPGNSISDSPEFYFALIESYWGCRYTPAWTFVNLFFSTS